MKNGLLGIILANLVCLAQATAAEFYKCIDNENSEFGMLIKTLDEPLGGQRFTAQVYAIQFCETSDRAAGCHKRSSNGNVRLKVECGHDEINLLNDLTAQEVG